jgi:AraC-like DNA-binding protein
MSCDHEDCGVLCDDRILAERLALCQAGGEGRSLTKEHVRAEGLRRIRLERAEQLLRAGQHTRQSVARRTELSHQQVGRLAERIGAEVVQAPPPVAEEEETRRILHLHAEGWSVLSIAKELGCSKSAVARRVSRVRRGAQADLVVRVRRSARAPSSAA